jgi:hypothetical protein
MLAVGLSFSFLCSILVHQALYKTLYSEVAQVGLLTQSLIEIGPFSLKR